MRILPNVGAAGFTDRERIALFQAIISYSGLTGAKAAVWLGVSYAHLQLVLSGKRFASPGLRDRLARFLGVPEDQIFPGLEQRRARRRAALALDRQSQPAASHPNMKAFNERLAGLKMSGPVAARKLQSSYNHLVCVLTRQRQGSDALRARIAAFLDRPVEDLFPSVRSTAPVSPMSGTSPNRMQGHSVSNPGHATHPGVSS